MATPWSANEAASVEHGVFPLFFFASLHLAARGRNVECAARDAVDAISSHKAGDRPCGGIESVIAQCDSSAGFRIWTKAVTFRPGATDIRARLALAIVFGGVKRRFLVDDRPLGW